MGGFQLTGPNYIIHSVPGELRCRCAGYRGTICEDLETLLVNKVDKILSFSDLPQTLREEMQKYHLGNTMEYKVIDNKKPKYCVLESNAGFNHGSWESMFAPLI